MENTAKDFEEVINANKDLTFEEYAAMKEPALNIVLRDYAWKLMEKNPALTKDEAMERAKAEVPGAFVPEWVKNLRIAANISGTTFVYLERINDNLVQLQDLISMIFEDKIEEYLIKHANDFKRKEE